MKKIPAEWVDYLKETLNKKKKGFSWLRFSFDLASLSSHKSNKELNLRLFQAVELFIISTDIIDDFMDNDNSEFNKIQDKKTLTKFFFKYSMSLVCKFINNYEVKKAFIRNLRIAFYAQVEESSLVVTEGFRFDNYFTQVLPRSFYLVYAIITILDFDNRDKLIKFVFCFVAFNQIRNDINNIISENLSDIEKRKPTLPIIMTSEILREENRDIFRALKLKWACYLKSESMACVPEIKEVIIESGSIEFCLLLQDYFFGLAYDSLLEVYPECEGKIDIVFQELRESKKH